MPRWIPLTLWLFSVLAAAACAQKPDERELAHQRFDTVYETRHSETWLTAGHSLIDQYFETAASLEREATADQAIEFALDELRTKTPSPNTYENYGELEPVP